MKKRIFAVLLVFATISLFAGCKDEPAEKPDEGSGTHVHTYGDFVITKEATCTEAGEKTKTCTECDDAQTEEIAPTGHTANRWTVKKEATCTSAGERCKKCTVCGFEFENVSIPKEAHKYVDNYVYPNNLQEGYVYSKCSSCNLELDNELPESIGKVTYEYIVDRENATCTITSVCTAGYSVIRIPEYIGSDKVVAIADNAFASNTDVVSVKLPKWLTAIGNYAFVGCTNMTSIDCGEMISSIGDFAFSSCASLETIALPSSVVTIGVSAFANCQTIKNISIPESVTVISDNMFKGCIALESVEFSSDVTSIGDSAFDTCTKLTKLSPLTAVTEIGENAFAYCKALTEITFGKSLASVGAAAFIGDTSLAKVNISELADWFGIVFASETSNPLFGTAGLYASSSLVKTVSVPSGVNALSSYVFYGYDYLTSITIPASVTEIGKSAFSGCTALTTATVNAKVSELSDYMFYGCTALTKAQLPKTLNVIGSYAFAKCEKLKTITIPSSVDVIGKSTFEGCGALTSITIPDGVVSVYDSAFKGCKKLRTITLPETLKTIGNYAFEGCAVSSLTIPEGTESIGAYAFSGAGYLVTVRIPESVVSIGEYAFKNCKNIKNLYIDSVEAWIKIKFENEVSNPLYSASSMGAVYVNDLEVTTLLVPDVGSEISDYALPDIACIKEIYFEGDISEFMVVATSKTGNSLLANRLQKNNVYIYSASAPTTVGNYWYYNEFKNPCKW